MTDFLSIFLATALVNNLVLVQLLGVSSLFAFSNSTQQAKEIALASFVLIFASGLTNSLLDKYLLTPALLQALRLLCFVTVSAVLATMLAILVRKHFALSDRRDHLAFLLAGINSAVIGSALVNTLPGENTVLQLFGYSLGSATGFSILLLAFAAMRERINEQAQPKAFQGMAIQLITAGLLAMSLLGLTGIA